MARKRKNQFIAAVAVMITLAGGSVLAGGSLDLQFEDATFANPLIIDNPYWPLRPNSTGIPRVFTYVGENDGECAINQVSVDDINYGGTYALNGAAPYSSLTAVQVVDTAWVFEDVDDCDPSVLLPADDAIEELTLDWYMQDDQENIWYVGEASRDFTDECPSLDDVPIGGDLGEFEEECTAGSWEAGVVGGEGDDAVTGVAGIVVPGDYPVDGDPLGNGAYYLQEVAFEAEDMAKILRQHAPLVVEDDEFADCRKVKEWNPFEHGSSVEHKWYCADGNGLVLIKGVGGGPTEEEVLVEVSPPL